MSALTTPSNRSKDPNNQSNNQTITQFNPLSIKHALGCQSSVRNGLIFIDDRLIIPVGYNLSINQSINQSINSSINQSETRSQQFIDLTVTAKSLTDAYNQSNNQTNDQTIEQLINQSIDRSQAVITCLSISSPKHSHSKGKLLAVAECRSINQSNNQSNDQSNDSSIISWINVYDLSTLKRKNKIPLVVRSNQSINQSNNQTINQSFNQSETGPIVSMSFSSDGKLLLTLTGPSINQSLNQSINQTINLTLWSWEKGKALISVAIPINQSINQSTFLTQAAQTNSPTRSDQSIDQSTSQSSQSFYELINQSIKQSIYQVTFCPTDQTIVCLTGPAMLRILHIENGEFRSVPYTMKSTNQSINQSINQSPSSNQLINQSINQDDQHDVYVCHSWLLDRLIVCSIDGLIHLFENAEYRGMLSASPALINQSINQTSNQINNQLNNPTNNQSVTINSVTSHSKGFMIGCIINQLNNQSNQSACCLIDYERDDLSIYRQSNIYQINESFNQTDDYEDDFQSINQSNSQSINQSTNRLSISHISINQAEDTVAISTSTNQCYLLHLSDQSVSQSIKQSNDHSVNQSNNQTNSQTKPLFEPFSFGHNGSISSIDQSIKQSTFVTCGADQTIKLFNYQSIHQSNNQSINQTINHSIKPNLVRSVSIHPSGLYLLIALLDQVQLCSIHIDGYNQTINQSINQSMNQSNFNQNNPIDPAINQISESISQSLNQSINQTIKLFKVFPINGVSKVQFSHGGATWVAINQSTIFIYDTWTCQSINQTINQSISLFNQSINPSINQSTSQSIAACYTEDDSAILTGGSDGSIYRTNVYPSVNQSINQSINQINQSLDESLCVARLRVPIVQLIQSNDQIYAACGDQSIKVINQTVNQSINQSINSFINQSNEQSTDLASESFVNQSITCMALVHQPLSQLLPLLNPSSNPSNNPSNNQSINQSNHSHRAHWLLLGTELGNIMLAPISLNQCPSTNQSSNQSILQSANQSTKQSNNQLINQSNNQLQGFVCPVFGGSVTCLSLSLDQSTIIATGSDGMIGMISINQSVNQSLNQSMGQSMNQSSRSINQSMNQSISQSINGDEQLISASVLKTQESLIQQLQATIQSINQSNNQSINQLHANFTQRLINQSINQENQLVSQSTKIKEFEKQAHDRQLAFESINQSINQSFNQSKQQLIEQHELKMQIEKERFDNQSVNQSIKIDQTIDQQKLAVEQHILALESYKQSISQSINQLNQKTAELNQSINQSINQFDESINQFDQSINQESINWKKKFLSALKTEKGDSEILTATNDRLKNEFKQANFTLAKLTQTYTASTLSYEHTCATLEAAKLTILQCENEIAERNQSINQKMQRSFELKKKNQELEKFRFVLDYKIAELNRLIEPSTLIKTASLQDRQDMVMEREEYEKKSLQIGFEAQKQRQKEQALRHQWNQIQSTNQAINQSTQQIQQDVSLLQEYLNKIAHGNQTSIQSNSQLQFTQPQRRELTKLLKQMYAKWVLEFEKHNQSPSQSSSKKPNHPFLNQSNHVQMLEKRVAAATMKLEHDRSINQAEAQRRRTEQIALTLRVNDLRKERLIPKQSNSQINQSNSQSAKQSDVLIDPTVMSEKRKQRLDEELAYQQIEIQQLQARLKELTGQSLVEEEKQQTETLPALSFK